MSISLMDLCKLISHIAYVPSLAFHTAILASLAYPGQGRTSLEVKH